MISFYAEDGKVFSGRDIHRLELTLGYSTQCAARGVVEMADGTVRIYTIRRPEHADLNGNTRLISEPLRQSFGVAVARLTQMERDYITDITGD